MTGLSPGHRKADGRAYDPMEFIEPRDRTARLRCGAGELEAWRRFAALQGRSLSEMMRDYVNAGCLAWQRANERSLDRANARRNNK